MARAVAGRAAQGMVSGPTHGVLFNVNPKTGATPSQKALAARIMYGVGAHHSDVPKAGSGAHGGNPNHDEQGRFT